jgi:eukaryotic-like serine/threonine-protein kinase
MSVANNLTGKTLSNRYEILRPLGEGGMGKVYLAKDERFGKQVVVKVPTMEAGDKDFKDRFMREIASIATLEHPHIVTTVDWGEIEGIPFLVLRYLGGGNLRDRITDAQGYYKPMPLEDLHQWLPQIASALDFIHSKNWVHRDLKPDNILFDEAGNPYLADFGIAKALEGAPMGVKTTMGVFIGTPQYMAPEMHLGKEVGPRSDQFGLAVLVYEALAGKIPFAGATPTAIFMEVMQDKARLIHELVPGIPLEKSNALMKGITKEPRDRYGSCMEFANAITGSMLARGSSSAGSETPSRVAIPDTRMETPKKPDIPGTRLEVPSKPEIAGTRLERTGDNPPIADEAVLYEKPMGKKGNSSAVFVLAGVVGGIALLGIILIISFIVVLRGGKSTTTVVSDKNKGGNRGFEKKEEATPLPEEKAKFAAIEKEMVLIPPGKFMMGSPLSEEFRSNDETQHEVNLTTPFYMGKYEVTQEQWQVVMGTNPSSRTKETKLPVTDVSWDDCQEFIKKLNAKTNGGYRLPTEAEWEYACRAGTSTAYSVGDSLSENNSNNYRGVASGIKLVGVYQANAFGLYDMHGNVAEWCEDWYAEDYSPGSVTDPKGPAAGEYRVLRGGSFIKYSSDARSSSRIYIKPADGFRLARTP